MDVAKLWDANKKRLEELAYRATQKGFSGDSALIVCIEVDSDWRPLVDHLMPGQDWQPFRDRGEMPVARGSVSRDIAGFFSAAVPALAPTLGGPPPRGLFHAVIMTNKEASIYEIAPRAP